ncbi:hypothetical protein E3Q23_04310 [Wallemia mellicola]|uniref:Glycosyl hydrolase family 32 C-terminal domain-containing protein n=1 Tax=Wallemia mellicola TaxID=1708541 RepID=A0A4T0T8Q7_9BASI|nr:hypothetical protein E3Q23_04310 [Wallemia mellicola]TIB98184.1 hypothetical protein E3Q16_04359 [Wallemia mellicola]TIC61614.1 hypothetical protein E3Q01_04297 [Wallemia mellicola]
MAPSTCRSMFHLYQKTEVSKSSKSASRTTTESENSVITIEIGIHYLWLVFTNIRFSLGPASINIPHDNKIKLRAVIDNSQIDLFVQNRIHFALMVFFQHGRVSVRLRYQNIERLTIDHLKLDALKVFGNTKC